jgi:hypothetical protein
MPFDLLLLPLLGGYVFVSRFNGLRYEAKRLNGQRLILLSALAGALLLALSYAIVKAIVLIIPQSLLQWRTVFPFNNLGPTAGALILGSTAWIPLNFMYHEKTSIERTINKWNDHLETLLDRSIREAKEVLIDLKNGKSYIGFVLSSYNPEYDRRYISLFPTLSGYRSKDTHELHLTTDYTNVWLRIIKEGPEENHEIIEDFEIVLPAGEILSAHIFNHSAYMLFNPKVIRKQNQNSSHIKT